MYFTKTTAMLAIATFLSTTAAHMQMVDPPPFRGKTNPNANGNVDFDMTKPLDKSGADFPCKGYLSDLGSPAGASVKTYNAGESYSFTIEGGAAHGGGSCQAAISVDGGNTFKVIHSYQGGCPLTPNWPFKIPADTPAGPAVFAWTWFNKIGNREMYMNCASVTIAGGSGSEAVPFSSRPNIYEANIGNGVTVPEGTDLQFPDPGPDFTGGSGRSGGSSGGAGGGTSPDPVSVAAAPSVIASPAPSVAAQPSIVAQPTADSAPSSPAAPPAAPPAELKASVNGECGGPQSCAGSAFGNCCSVYGYCGSSALHCGDGCQPGFGLCGPEQVGAEPVVAAQGTGSKATTGELPGFVGVTQPLSARPVTMVTHTKTELVSTTVLVNVGGGVVSSVPVSKFGALPDPIPSFDRAVPEIVSSIRAAANPASQGNPRPTDFITIYSLFKGSGAQVSSMLS
jgi:hypothetical protein